MKQSIRIIGGLFRGKKLFVLDLPGLRPTPDRVRETLFNWLMQDIRGARCLDAFSGSGALGFEAYSRGAKHVLMIEYAESAFLHLRKQAKAFNTTDITVLHQDAHRYLQQTKEQFDIIFLDPPFAKDDLLSCVQLIVNTNVLVPNGLLYLESPKEVLLDPKHWEQLKLKHAGKVTYALYKKLVIP